MIDHRLIELLRCPVCKGPLVAGKRAPGEPLTELISPAERLAYPVIDGIPHMVPSEARVLAPDEPLPT